MPSTRILNEKKKAVEELVGRLKSKAGVFVDYSGITVNEDTQLRVKMRESSVSYSVIKNTLMRFAIKEVGFDDLDSILHGTTSLAVCDEDPVAPARIVKEFADKLPNYFEIKAGFMDGKVLSVNEVRAIAGIPPLPILHAQLLGTMLAPISGLAIVLKAIADNGGIPTANAKKSSSDDSEPAPAVVEEAAKEASAEAAVEEATEATAEEASVKTEKEEAAPEEATKEVPAEVAEETVAEEAAVSETAATAVEETAETKAEAPAKEAPVKVEKKEADKTKTAETKDEKPESKKVPASSAAPKKAPAAKKAASDEKPEKPAAKATAKKAPVKKAASDEKSEKPAAKTPAKKAAVKKDTEETKE